MIILNYVVYFTNKQKKYKYYYINKKENDTKNENRVT